MKQSSMKKGILVLSLLALVVVASPAQAAGGGGKGVPLPINIDGTSWSGTVKVVSTDNTTQEGLTTVTFTFQDGNFFAGTMTDMLNPDATVSFSGVIGPLKPFRLHMTAPNQVTVATVVKAGRANKLFIRGGNTATGATFLGVLQRQQSPDKHGVRFGSSRL
jgi:hypothetical protein